MSARKQLSLLAVLVLMLLLATTHTVLAAEYSVNSGSACSLADAIEAANQNQAVGGCIAGGEVDVIRLSGDITLSAELPSIRSDMTIISDNLGVKRAISGNFAYRIFNIKDGPNVTLRSLQLTAGRNTGMRGGAVRILSGNVALIDVRMENNWAELGGGALRAGSTGAVSCTNCVFVDNQSTDGGAIWVGDAGNLTLVRSAVHNNTGTRGGGMYVHSGRATLVGTSFSNNHAPNGQDIFTIDAEIEIRP